MMSPGLILINLGAIFLLGIATDFLGRRTRLPRVTLLLLFGLSIGPAFFDLIPLFFIDRFELVADVALVLVGFLLGGRLTAEVVKLQARQMVWISLVAALSVAVVITSGLLLVGVELPLAVILGCIASATAPAATMDVISETKAQGPFVTLLTGIVALDDAWALILFSIGLAVAGPLAGGSVGYGINFGIGFGPMLTVLWEIGGALLLGVALGLPAAMLTGRLKPGQPILTEALGLVFLCGGLALWLEVSFLIASMVMGAVVANRARHHEYPFHAIEDIEGPVLVLFFILAGAALDPVALQQIGVVGVSYLLLRTVGKVAGGWLGSRLGQADGKTRRWIGLAMLPQAGVAIGMGLVAASQFPHYRSQLLSIVIGSTVVFELIGPIMTRLAIKKTSAIVGK